ncbi:hypothetical protein [Natronorubrum halophilum]|uniref:hypothetical protein n=1 Tax=Natronorubrum halophilum TaxID=1702106 RepID=UPI0010C1FF33|nr:hypothetical protein [Natronorubrum halophilum]
MSRRYCDCENIQAFRSSAIWTQLKIVLVGIFVGIVFAWLLEPAENTRIYTILATVQGSFLAISISVVLLSFQITSNEYTSLSLEDIQHEIRLNRVIGLFVISILLNLYYATDRRHDLVSALSEIHDWFGVIVIHLTSPFSELSVATGIATGLATICLLQIIPIRNRMVATVGPENLLNSRVETLDFNDVPLLENRSLREPPQRNPLLTIDQILNAAERRNDEFTIRRSIFEMGRATSKLIEFSQQRGSAVDEDALFEYWDGCIDIACKGGMRRMSIAARAKSSLTISLLNNDRNSAALDRIDQLSILTQEAISREEYQQLFLVEYAAISGHAAKADNSELTVHVIKELHVVTGSILETEDEAESPVPTPEVTTDIIETISYIGYSSLLLSINYQAGRQEKREEILKSLLVLLEELSGADRLEPDERKQVQRTTAQHLSAVVAAGLSRGDMQLTQTALKSVVEMSLLLNETENETIARIETRIQNKSRLWHLLIGVSRSFPRYECALPKIPDQPDLDAIEQRFESVFEWVRNQT